MTNEGMIPLLAFLMASSAVLLVFTLVGGRRTRVDERIADLDGRRAELPPEPASVRELARTALPRVGAALVPEDEKQKTLLRTRLIHAGFYGRQAMPIFLGAKLLLMVGPALAGVAAGLVGLITMQLGALGGACLGILGMIGPSFWLDSRKAARQATFRRALPDALDVIVICLEGGLSLPGALRRVAVELRTAHPTLAAELNIVQREIQLGRTAGDALQQMGIRTDLEEVRGLASVISQSERFGASLVRSLRVHAETLRLRRRQAAEEMAQKAATKVLFPTLIFIFPAIFVVILGPAAVQVMQTLGEVNRGR